MYKNIVKHTFGGSGREGRVEGKTRGELNRPQRLSPRE